MIGADGGTPQCTSGGHHDELLTHRLTRLLGITHDEVAPLLAETSERLDTLVRQYRGSDS